LKQKQPVLIGLSVETDGLENCLRTPFSGDCIMQTNRIKNIMTLAIVAVAGIALADSTAHAVNSIDFNFRSSPTHAGEPDKASAPIFLPGQVDPWDELLLTGTNPSVTTAGGTFTITGTSNTTFEQFDQPAPGRSDLRQDSLQSNTGRRWVGPIPWELTGLDANSLYDLSFFRGPHPSYNVLISGATSAIDADGDYNFTGVSSGTGSISGHFDVINSGTWYATTGLQFEKQASTGGGIPEPATATLTLLGLGGLMMRRRNA
jgi:hypothetical protein